MNKYFQNTDYDNGECDIERADIEDMCPECGALWGFEEVTLERCFACGWPFYPYEEDWEDAE